MIKWSKELILSKKILNADLLEDTHITPYIRIIATKASELIYKEFHCKMSVNSVYRPGDKKKHGSGEAIDISLSHYNLHIYEWCGVIAGFVEAYCTANNIGYGLRIYEGIDPKDGKYKQHIHIEIHKDPEYRAYSTGVYHG